MKKFLGLLALTVATAVSAHAQTTTTTPEQSVTQQQTAVDARDKYDEQKKESRASAQASRDTRSAMNESKQHMREQKKQLHEQQAQLKTDRKIEKANVVREKEARTQMRDEKKRAKAMN